MIDVVGLDPSLTKFGFSCSMNTGHIALHNSGMERLADLRDAVRAICEGAGLIVIEGYAFGTARPTKHGKGGSPSQAHALGELGGVVRLALHEAGAQMAEVAPATLKRFATGKGNASKDEVLSAATHRSGVPFDCSNCADAWFLRAMGCEHLGAPIVSMPVAHRAALDAVQWPELVS